MKNNILTINDTAKIMGVSTARVRFLCKNGKITASKHGREWVIFADDLDKYFEGKKMNDSEQYGLVKWDSSKTSAKNIEVPENGWYEIKFLIDGEPTNPQSSMLMNIKKGDSIHIRKLYDWRDRVTKMDEMIAKEEPKSLLKLTEL